MPRTDSGMKHEDGGRDHDPAAFHVPPAPSKSKQSGSYFKIHFGLKQARTQGAPSRSAFDPRFFAVGGGGGTGRGRAVRLLRRAELSSAPPGSEGPSSSQLAKCRYCKFQIKT